VALELLAPALERLPPHLLAVPEHEVERDEVGRDLPREPADTALGGVQSHLHQVELDHAVAGDQDLAVEGGVGRKQVAQGPELREVPEQRAAVPAPQRELAAVVLEHAAEAVPLRLVAPAVALRERRDELRLHRRKRDVRAGACDRVCVGHGVEG
jgi:hypothetical protein